MGHAELEPEDIDESISASHGALKRTWTAFCATTSIHGLKYTRDEETNKFVRFIWLLLTLIMFTCAVVMVYTFYKDYQSNPTRLHVENDYAPVSSLYFPAISICPEVLYNMYKAEKFIGSLKLPPESDVKDLMDAMRVNYGFIRDEDTFGQRRITLMQNLLDLNNLTISKFQEEVRFDCDDFIFRCRYRYDIVECSELFEVARTVYGYCCSFNLNQTGLHFKGLFARPSLRGGLSVVVYYNEEFDLINSYSHGFRILLHENNAFPSARLMAKFIPLNEEVFITIRPVETFCSKAVADLPIEERQCVFPNEFPLKNFDTYVGNNCEMNFRILNMIKFCGCVTYFFKTNETNDRVCTYTDVPCLTESFADIIGRYRNTQAVCPMSCEMTTYDLQLSSATLALDIPTVDPLYDNMTKDFSVAHIFINSPVYRRVRHDLLSNTVALVANLGSAFSLFVGMSMVSLVEIAYYFTVILCKYYKQECKAREKLFFRRTTVGALVQPLEKTIINK